MDISAFETKLKGLLDEVSNLPATKSNKVLMLSSKTQKTKVEDSLDDSLEHLQLIVKYLLFDVEATRRENMYLRKVLEGRED
jgi:hypothetical protein